MWINAIGTQDGDRDLKKKKRVMQEKQNVICINKEIALIFDYNY